MYFIKKQLITKACLHSESSQHTQFMKPISYRVSKEKKDLPFEMLKGNGLYVLDI